MPPASIGLLTGLAVRGAHGARRGGAPSIVSQTISREGEIDVVLFMASKFETLRAGAPPTHANIPPSADERAPGIARRSLSLQHADRHEPPGHWRRLPARHDYCRGERRHHRLLLFVV